MSPAITWGVNYWNYPWCQWSKTTQHDTQRHDVALPATAPPPPAHTHPCKQLYYSKQSKLKCSVSVCNLFITYLFFLPTGRHERFCVFTPSQTYTLRPQAACTQLHTRVVLAHCQTNHYKPWLIQRQVMAALAIICIEICNWTTRC